ncbi:MAG TPA: hypothetical protein VFH93_14450 [Thermoleophilia bacterium]|nr:hypothetical protein [Thermoleophilia bacterium]
MSDNLMSRRKFLAGAGLVLGAASVSSVALLKDPDPANAAGQAVPWPYPRAAVDQPNPEALARRAFEVYMAGGRGCAEATWWPFVEYLSADNPDTWGTIPANMFRYGAGGVAGWGTVCGTLNAAGAVINMAVADGGHRGTLTNGIFQYYAETPLPTNGAWKSYQGALELDPWTPDTPNDVVPLENVPSSTANSPLCHSSLVQWTMTTGAANGGPLQKDRCGKACFDVTHKLTELLNAYFEAITPSATPAPPGVPLDPAVAACGACHATYTGAKMACGSCHDNTLTDGHFGD